MAIYAKATLSGTPQFATPMSTGLNPGRSFTLPLKSWVAKPLWRPRYVLYYWPLSELAHVRMVCSCSTPRQRGTSSAKGIPGLHIGFLTTDVRKGKMRRSIRASRRAAGLLARAAAPVAIALCLLSSDAQGASYIWDGELNNSFTYHDTFQNKTNWSPEQVPGPADSATITGANVVIEAVLNYSIGTLTTTGGSLTISASLTINNSGLIDNPSIRSNLTAVGPVNLKGEGTWFNGVISGAGGTTNAGTLLVQPAGGDRIVAGQFTNQGTFSLNTAMRIQDAAFLNTGTFNVNGQITNVGNGQLFNNNLIHTTGVGGIHTRLISSGTISAATPQNGPAADLVIDGNSQFTGGSFSVAGGAVIRLEGITVNHVIAGDVTAGGVGDLSIRNNAIVNGSLNSFLEGARGLYLMSGSITGTGSIINTKTATLGGTVISNTGGFTNESGGTLLLNNDAVHFVTSKLLNRGTIIHDARNLDVSSEAGLDNQPGATYEMRGGNSGYDINGVGTFENRGTILKKDPNTVTVNLRLNQRGTIDVQQGILNLRGGVHQHHSGAELKVSQGATVNLNSNHTFFGATRFEGQGTANLSEQVYFAAGTATFNMTGPGAIWQDQTDTLFLEGNIDNRGYFAIGGLGIVQGVGTGKFINSAGGTLNIFGGPRLSAPLENNGTVTQTAVNFRLDTDTTLTNRGDYDVTSGAILPVTGAAGPYLFDNRGRFIKSGHDTFSVEVPFNNSGVVRLNDLPAGSAGSLNFRSDGRHSDGAIFRAGANTTLRLINGNHHSSGGTSFLGQGVVELSAGYVNDSGTTTFNMSDGGLFLINSFAYLDARGSTEIHLQGQSQWNGGILNGGSMDNAGNLSGGFVNSGHFKITGSSTERTLQSSLSNSGRIDQAVSLVVLGDNRGIVNTGSHHLIGNQTIRGGSLNNDYINRGTIVSSAPNVFISLPLNFVSGNIFVDSGILTFNTFSFSNSTGSGAYSVTGTLRFLSHQTFDGFYEATGTGIVEAGPSSQVFGDFYANLTGTGSFNISGGRVGGDPGHPLTNLGNARFNSGEIAGAGGMTNLGTLTIPNIPATIRTVSTLLNNGGTVLQEGGLELKGTLHNQSSGLYHIKSSMSGLDGIINNLGHFRATAPSITVVPHMNNTGKVTVDAGTNLNLAGDVIQFNAVDGALDGGEWIINGRLTLEAGQPIHTLNSNVTIGPAGVFANIVFGADFENDGRLHLQGGNYACDDFENNGTVILDSGASISGDIDNDGTIRGSGAINGSLVNKAFTSPGQSPGILSINGSFAQTPTGKLEIELSGLTAGVEYDRLAITGPATLAGNLDLALLSGYIPTPYTPFTILTATSITGIFDTITGMDAGNGLLFATSYFSDRVEVMAVLPGDLNFDRQVSIADFIDLAGRFNTSDATWRDGDINGDGAVSISDFISLASHFNTSYVAGGPAMGLVVPEPGSLALLGLLPLALRRRRM